MSERAEQLLSDLAEELASELAQNNRNSRACQRLALAKLGAVEVWTLAEVVGRCEPAAFRRTDKEDAERRGWLKDGKATVQAFVAAQVVLETLGDALRLLER